MIVFTLDQSHRNRWKSLRELHAGSCIHQYWPCNNMPLNMISLCFYTNSCSDTRLCMCTLSVPTDYSALALSSCRPASVKDRPSPIHYFRAVEDAELQSEPVSKQTSDSLHVLSFTRAFDAQWMISWAILRMRLSSSILTQGLGWSK